MTESRPATAWEGRYREEGGKRITMVYEEILGEDGYVYYLDGGYEFTSVQICRNSPYCLTQMYIVHCISIISQAVKKFTSS